VAGTMPHAIFVETGLDDGASVAAYAAELPGCAVFASTDAEAAGAMPRRVAAFVDWLRAAGEEAPTFVGDNWYEVERAAVAPGTRASFSLDDLPPGAAEFDRFLRWLELAREALADALDAAEKAVPTDAMAGIENQDRALAAQLGAEPPDAAGESIDRLYAARDTLTAALQAAGPAADGVRRAIRLAIADDLRLAAQLQGR